MAVYGKHRDKWNPRKQSKAKVSKNRTIAWAKTADSTAKLKDFLWCHVSIDGEIGTIQHIDGNLVANTAPTVATTALSVLGTSSNLTDSPVTSARFEPTGTGFVSGSRLCFSNNLDFTEKDYWLDHNGDYKYVSLWLKLDQQHAGAGSDGHSIMAIGRSRTDSDLGPEIFDPWMSISTNSTKQVSLKLSSANTDDSNTTGPYVHTGGSPKVSVLSYTSSSSVTAGKWHHVLFAFDNSGAESCKVYIDGSLAANGPITSFGSYPKNSRTSINACSLRVGNKCGGYSTIDTTTIESDAGFDGSVADFMMFTLEQAPDDVARIVYEASREGVHALHSGIHNSSPRLEQLDLDRDSLYPPNFTIENYTMGAYQPPQERKNGILVDSNRVSSRSESRFTEGYNTADAGYAWSENASQYFINSNKIMPHLRINPADTILTNGNWYSDARSEFFPDDLHQNTGFVVTNDSSDEVYREHQTEDTAQKYVETELNEDFKDCFVIEIPIPNASELVLGTDRQSVHSSSAETARIASGNVTVNPGARIANMAYYNFSLGKWQDLNHGSPGDDDDYALQAATPADTNFIDYQDIGFSPMSGIIVPNIEPVAEKVLPLYGLPTSDFGFPIAEQFSAIDGQSIDLSKYIDEPVILKGWEVKTKVVPVVGYSEYTDDNSQDGTFGYSVGSGKSPFHYGAHGESAVFFDSRKNVTGFDENIYTDGAHQYHMGTTVPVTAKNGSGVEIQPTKAAKGLVTSGITTFLLKKEKITDTSSLADTFFLTKDKKKISKLSDLTDDANFGSSWQTLAAANTEVDKETTYSQHGGGSSVPYIATDASAFSNSSNTSILGWLQHIYHNDPELTTIPNRKHWVRDNDAMNSYKYTEGKNIIGMLAKENTTYISNLLYDNVLAVNLQVQGKLKTVGSKDNGAPVSNFFIKPASGTGMGIRLTDQSTDISKKYAISTTSETSIAFGDTCIGDHSITPRFGAGANIGSTKMPRINFPSKRSGADSVDQFHKDVKLFDSIVDHSTAILNPTDELILGIQNSISTVYASQQIKGNTDDFIRWGRTSLTIPAQTAADSVSFLRLFVKKTRSDKDFNLVSDSSRYNQNVNRDLGDQANADQHVVSNPTIYSGSMADDIMGPTVLTEPIIIQGIKKDNTLEALPVIDINKNQLPFAAMLSTFFARTNGSSPSERMLQYYWDAFKSAGNLNLAIAVPNILEEHFVIPWSAISQRAWDNTTNQPLMPLHVQLSDTENPSENMMYGVLGGFQSVIVHPTNMRFSFTSGGGVSWPNGNRYGMGMISVLEELCDLDTNPTDFSSYAYTDPNVGAWSGASHTDNFASLQITAPGNASSGWYTSISFPILQKIENTLEPEFSSLTVEFRWVRIGAFASNNTAVSYYTTNRLPEYQDGTEMAVEDAFYFDKIGHAIKLNIDISNLQSLSSHPSNQNWARNWQTAKSTLGKQIIYIVATQETIKKSTFSLGPVFSSNAVGAFNIKTYEGVYSIIRNVMKAIKIVDSTMTYVSVDDNDDFTLRLHFPNDPVLRSVINTFKSAIDTANIFKLSGKDIVAGGVPAGEVYLQAHPSDASTWWTTPFSASVSANFDFWKQQWESTASPGTSTLSIGGFSPPIMRGWLRSKALPNFTATTGVVLAIPDAGSFAYTSTLAGGSLRINYIEGIPSTNPSISITKETFSANVPYVDRKVVRRSSVSSSTSSAEAYTGPKEAGPFGSLNRFTTFLSAVRYWDSMYPSIATLSKKSIDLTQEGYPFGWLLTQTDKKIFDVELSSIKTRMDIGGSGFETVHTQDSLPIISTSLTNGSFTWAPAGTTNSSSSWPTVFTNGAMPIRNYIAIDFDGVTNVEKKTGSDLVCGFGNQTAGRHNIRPSVYKYSSFQGVNGSTVDANLSTGVQKLVVELVIDPPRGARFGLMNVAAMTPKYIYSRVSFGHFRDMLEQGLDTKFINHASNERVFGAPVVVNAINITNPEIPKLMTNTSRYNKTINATVTKPYIEDNYEAIQQPINLESETLRVDVAGAIRSNRVLAPGSITSNIRSR